MRCHWCRVELVTLPLTSAMDDLRATALLQSASEHAAGYAHAATGDRKPLHYELTAVSVNTQSVGGGGEGPKGKGKGNRKSGGNQDHRVDQAQRTLAGDVQALLATSRFLPGLHARTQPRQGMAEVWAYSRSIPSEVPSSPAVVRRFGWLGVAHVMASRCTERVVACMCSSIAECTMAGWRMDAMSW